MDSEVKRRPSMVERYGNASSDPADEYGSPVKDARQAVPTPMLDVVKKDGHIESFNYAYLVRASFEPEDRLTLHFGEDKVIIKGRNLQDMRQKIRLHKADTILEGLAHEDFSRPENAAHIESIMFDLAEEREKEKSVETGRGKGFIR